MSNTLIQLPSFSYTSLDFETIINDIRTLIRQHPEYQENWDDFLESNAGRMFVETMAFIIEKLAAKLDWNAQELYLSTATQRQSLINLLKLINHKPSLPKAAKVNIKGKITKWTEGFSLPVRETIIGTDTNGNTIRFECIDNASDGKPDYNYQFTVNTGTELSKVYDFYNIPFFQGTTYVEDSIFIDGVDNEIYTLEQYPVIENSVRVYVYESGLETTEVDSFISPEAQQNDILEDNRLPPYMVSIDASNKATIVWGAASIVKTHPRGTRLKIMYRVGGGANTNITAGAINTTKTYSLSNNARVSMIFTNPEKGFGGADEEDIDQAKLIAPISLRSANKTVTREDYITHLGKCQIVFHSHIIGKENEPEDIFLEYGYFLPPLETWIYICPKRDAYNSIDPFYYNKYLKIGRPYTKHYILDSETISFSNTIQSVYLKKLRKYMGLNLYITIEGGHITKPFYKDTDYILEELTGKITRISTAEGGTIPTGDITLTVNYIDESTESFYNNTVLTLSGDSLFLDTVPNGIYPTEPVIIKKDNGTVCTLGVDYSINYETNRVSRIAGGFISAGETVFIQYANHWIKEDDDDSEERIILNSIKNKKMICVDNIIKDSRYTTFDVVATIYCYKNMRQTVENNIKKYMRDLYSLDNGKFNVEINKTKFGSDIMGFNGVRYADITYLGKNYEAYRRFILDTITLDELNDMDANKVELSIPAKYNEMLLIANDHYDSESKIVENQRAGLIFTFKDA